MILPFARRTLRILSGLLALTCPFAAAFAQSSSTDQSSSSSQKSSAPAQTPAQSQPTTLEPPPAKQDSLAEAARKAKATKPAPTKGKVYTEDDLKGMNGPGVSVIGDPPRKGQRAQSADPDDDNGQNPEAYWRGRAQQFLEAIAQTDEQIAQKKEEIKKFGSGGFDVATGMKDNIAYINDRNAQLKQLEAHKADLEKQFEELQDEGRKAGVPSSWFR